MYGVIQEGIETCDTKKNEDMKRDWKKDGKRVLQQF